MKRFLFIRLVALGDAIQAAAALRLFRDHCPDIQIDWVVDRSLVPLIESFGVVDRVIAIDAAGLFSGSLGRRLANLWRAVRQLSRLGTYDTVYCTHPDWRYGLLSCLVKTRMRVSPKRLARYPGYIVGRHRVFEYYRLLTGVDQGLLSIDGALSQLGAAAQTSPGAQMSTRFELPEQYIALMPGGAKNALRDDPLRRWPMANYIELTQQLIAQGRQVVLLGGPGDQWVSEYFAQLPVTNLIGKTGLLDMVAVLSDAECAVTHDSGPLHLAAITPVALVAIFGPTPANAVLSFSRDKTLILQPENRVACSPCYDGRGYAACSKNRCMEATTVDAVLHGMNRLLTH